MIFGTGQDPQIQDPAEKSTHKAAKENRDGTLGAKMFEVTRGVKKQKIQRRWGDGWAKRVEMGRRVSARQRKPRWDAGLEKIIEVARWTFFFEGRLKHVFPERIPQIKHNPREKPSIWMKKGGASANSPRTKTIDFGTRRRMPRKRSHSRQQKPYLPCARFPDDAR